MQLDSNPSRLLGYLIEYLETRLPDDDCWLWPFAYAGGNKYGYVSFQGRQRYVHRIAFLWANGRWPQPCGLHRCDIPRCFNPRHIWEGTQTENCLDRDMKGRTVILRGSKNGLALLTEESVRQIRSERAKMSVKELAKKYKVTPWCIYDVLERRSWTHVV